MPAGAATNANVAKTRAKRKTTKVVRSLLPASSTGATTPTATAPATPTATAHATPTVTAHSTAAKGGPTGAPAKPAQSANPVLLVSTPSIPPASPESPLPAPPSAPQAKPVATLDSARAQRMTMALETWLANTDGVDSMMVALRVNGQAWEASARHDRGPARDPHTRYRAMSITKTVTATLVLRAVEAGMVSLDAPLPAIDGVATPVPKEITIRQLLAHRSGLADYTESPGYQADQPMTPELAVALSLRAPLVSVPGTTTRYVNSNYLLLGLLLQQIHHRTYADLVADLTNPLGLVDTKVEPPDRPGWAGFASGGMMSTAADMARWGEQLFTPGRVMSPASFALMSTTGDLGGGLGLWSVCPCDGASSGINQFSAIGHFTAAGGMFHFPRTGITLVMNAEPATGDTVARAVSLHQALAAELFG